MDTLSSSLAAPFVMQESNKTVELSICAFPSFGKLPLELRREVYSFYFKDSHGPVAVQNWPHVSLERRFLDECNKDRRSSKGPQPFFPNICLANRQTGMEAAEYLISTAAWTIDSAKVAHIFTRIFEALLDGVFFLSIRQLSFPRFGFPDFNMGHRSLPQPDEPLNNPFSRLLELATDLRVLRLGFQELDITCIELVLDELPEESAIEDWSRSTGYHRRKVSTDLSELVANFQLYRIDKCQKLQRLVMDGFVNTDDNIKVDGDLLQVLVELGVWFRRLLEFSGINMEITLNRWEQTTDPRGEKCANLVDSVIL